MYGYEFLDMCDDLIIDGHEYQDLMEVLVLGFNGSPCLRFQDDDIWKSRVLQLNPTEVKIVQYV